MNDEIDVHLGRRLRRRRLLGLTQQQLAGACGVRFQQIQKYECAANRMSAARLWQLAEVLQVPAPELRRALAEIPKIGEPILNALIMRRMRLKRDKEFAGLRILAEADSREGRQLDDFLEKNHIPHRLVDAKSEQGAALASRLHLSDLDLPALITPTGAPLRQPSFREVAQVAGLLRPLAADDEEEIHCDLVIVGAGPAGLAAAVYATSEGLKTVVLESYATGGQAGTSSLIENFAPKRYA